MRTLLLLLSALILNGLFATRAAEAQDIGPKPFDYPWDVEVFDLPVSANGIGYRLYVRAPLRKPADGEQPSTIYFLDALNQFTPAAAMSYNYEYFNYIPASYFVGIGYQNEADGMVREENRTRDYTPTSFSPPDDSHFLADHPVDWQGSGGAHAFFQVVRDEIIPFMESRFDVDPMDRVLVGKSVSGLGAASALLGFPGLFNRYVIISPSLWWDDWLEPLEDRAIMEMAREAAGTTYPVETRVYLAAGEAEERLGVLTDIYYLQHTLRNRRDPNLKFFVDILPGEQHEGVFPAAFMRGIVGVYANEPARKPSASPVHWN